MYKPNNTNSSYSITRVTTQDNVVDNLRGLILNHYFKPGVRLLQDDLAELLGVSRTPIREALVKLASEGLVTFSPYKGASVVDFSFEDLNEIYTVRIALESYAAYLAAQNITENQIDYLRELLRNMKVLLDEWDQQMFLEMNREFHTGIYASARAQRLLELINNYLDRAEKYRRIFVNLLHGREEMVDHQEVLIALHNHDAKLAGELTRSHLQTAAAKLAKFIEQERRNFDENPEGQ